MRVVALACALFVLIAYTDGAGLTLDRVKGSGSSLFFSMIAPIPDATGKYPLQRPWHACRANNTRHENLCIRRLNARVSRLELALSALCSSIIHADDVAYSERMALGMGPVYQDFNLTTRRRPRWLRGSVYNIATLHNIHIPPPQTHWQLSDIVAELDADR